MTDMSIKSKALSDISLGKLHFDVARQYGLPTKTLFMWTAEQKSAAHNIQEHGFAALMTSLKRLVSM
ncbi:hypothetical protein [Shewanella sp.]|uniref:hypothetical protein n=1 Tax=Shewanella sp. TaxID=50422 RepID=UPI003A977207